MKKSLHYWLPGWVSNIVKNKQCIKCKLSHSPQDIIAVHLREKEEVFVFCVEHMCSKCKHRSLTSFNKKEASLEEMCYFILNNIKKKKLMEKSKHYNNKKKKGPITISEAKNIINCVRKIKTHNEFLRKLGLPDD